MTGEYHPNGFILSELLGCQNASKFLSGEFQVENFSLDPE